MATTTNYAWETPDDTDLVKDGAAAIRTLGSSIDTTTKALNPSTTLGDIEYRSATANTNTRLGIGTNGQYLSVTGGVPAWADVSAGGMTLLSTTTLSGASTTISGISQDFNSLLIITRGITASTNYFPRIAVNNLSNVITSGQIGQVASSVVTTFQGLITLVDTPSTQTYGSANTANNSSTQIFNYTNTSFTKSFITCGGFNTGANDRGYGIMGSVSTTSAVTSLVFSPNTGTFSGGTVLLYGVK
jgi:hypothetical protein